MYSVHEGFQTQRSTQFDDNLETQLQVTHNQFQGHMRTVTKLTREIEESKLNNSGTSDTDKVKTLQRLLQDEVYPIIASLHALKKKYEHQADSSRDNFNENDTLWKTTNEMGILHTEIQEQQQKLDSTQALATQSLEMYRHQKNLLWVNAVGLLLLVLAAGYMYYYTHTMSSEERSITNPPDDLTQTFDNKSLRYHDYIPEDGAFAADEDDDMPKIMTDADYDDDMPKR